MARSYVPDAGDIVWISFDPQTGHEQAGHRPAVVLSPAAYNAKTSLMVCCPMTTQIKNYPFEVLVTSGGPSAVLGGSGEESRLAEETGQTQRDNIAGRTGGNTGKNPRADRLSVRCASRVADSERHVRAAAYFTLFKLGTG